jgi:hypothetical protein
MLVVMVGMSLGVADWAQFLEFRDWLSVRFRPRSVRSRGLCYGTAEALHLSSCPFGSAKPWSNDDRVQAEFEPRLGMLTLSVLEIYTRLKI